MSPTRWRAGFRQENGTLGGTGVVTLSGPAAITFGLHTGAGTTALQGTSTISGSGRSLDANRLFRVENVLTWSGGQIQLNGAATAGSGTIRTLAGASFLIDGDNLNDLFASNQGGADTGLAAPFDNQGALRKVNSTFNDLTTIATRLTNSGVVDVQTGILSFTGGGTHGGKFTVAAGAELNFSGTHNLTGLSGRLEGNGRVEGSMVVNGGTVSAGTSAGALTFGTSGTLSFSDTLGQNSTLEVELSGATANAYDRILLD